MQQRQEERELAAAQRRHSTVVARRVDKAVVLRCCLATLKLSQIRGNLDLKLSQIRGNLDLKLSDSKPHHCTPLHASLHASQHLAFAAHCCYCTAITASWWASHLSTPLLRVKNYTGRRATQGPARVMGRCRSNVCCYR